MSNVTVILSTPKSKSMLCQGVSLSPGLTFEQAAPLDSSGPPSMVPFHKLQKEAGAAGCLSASIGDSVGVLLLRL